MDVRDLVRIQDHGDGAPGKDGPRELRESDQAALDMHVAIQKSRRDPATRAVDLLPTAVSGTRSHHLAVRDGHIRFVDFSGQHIDQASAS